jgi:hypothetical protein
MAASRSSHSAAVAAVTTGHHGSTLLSRTHPIQVRLPVSTPHPPCPLAGSSGSSGGTAADFLTLCPLHSDLEVFPHADKRLGIAATIWV